MFTTVQIVQQLSIGGIETLALDFAQYSQASEDNYIVSLQGNKQQLIDKWPRLKPFSDRIICLEKPAGFSLTYLCKLKQILKELNADCVHTHHIGPLIYGSIAARLAGVKNIIHTEHDAWHLNDIKHRRLEKWILALTRPTFIADSQVVADHVKATIGDIDIKVIYNGINTDKFVLGNEINARSKFNLPSDVKIIGCAGRLEPVKGQSVLIEAIARLPHSVHLALAGSGSNEQALRKQVVELELSERVHFLGLVDDMPSFYQSLDIFCLPSYHEGFPLAALEAQSCGIPVVLTQTGATKEAMCPEFGELVPPGNSYALANAIRKVNKRCFESKQQATPDAKPCQINQHHRNFVKQFAAIEQMLSAYTELKTQHV